LEKKIGVYICTDCEIGEALNIEGLVKVATKMKAPLVKTHPFLCGKEGVEFIKREMNT